MCIPNSEDSYFVVAAGEVGDTPGKVERDAFATVSKVIDPRPADLVADGGISEDKTGLGLPKCRRVPLASQTVLAHTVPALVFIGGRCVYIDVAIFQEPSPRIFCERMQNT